MQGDSEDEYVSDDAGETARPSIRSDQRSTSGLKTPTKSTSEPQTPAPTPASFTEPTPLRSSMRLSSSLKKSGHSSVHIQPDVTEIPEEKCDDILNNLVESREQSQSVAEENKHQQHDPDCPMYEEDEGMGEKYTTATKKQTKQAKSKDVKTDTADDDGPCPPGVRRCCTCGVCPLDLIDKEEGEDESEDKNKESEEDESKEKDDSEEKEKEKRRSDQRSLKDEFSDDYLSQMSDWDLSDVYADWDGEGWGRKWHHRGPLEKESSRVKSYLKRVVEGAELPSPPMSDRSRHEGSIFEDYTKFFIEPLEVCYKTLSSVSSSYVSCEETGLQRTIVIVKPPAVPYKEAILRVIFENGFQILGSRVLHLTPEQVSEIYAKYYGSPSFVHLVVSISESPVLAICISAMNVIKRWLNLIGPDGSLRAEWFYPLSMRKLFGLQGTHADWIHGSENLREASKESRYFYPNAIIEPILQDLDKVTDYCALTMNKSIVDACTELVKKRPADPIIFFADYLLLNNPFQPRFPDLIAMTPT